MVLEDFSLQGRVALITGGGSGIGMGIAAGLMEAGAAVACVYNSHAPEALEACAHTLGVDFLPVQADLSKMENLPLVMEATLSRFGKLDILVNNSGICPRCNALEYTERMWDDIIRLNEKAVFFLSQLAARQFLRQGTRGKIINIASMLSYLGGFNTAAYTASKHAVMGITRVLASEWGSMGVNVNAIAPGWIKTNLSAPLRADPERDSSVRARIPMGDWGDPMDFKGVAVLLASDAGNYINGVTIPVDGGYLTK